MADLPDLQQEKQDEPILDQAPERDELGRYKAGHSGNPDGRFTAGTSGNPKGRPPGRGFKETILRLLQDRDNEGLSQTDQLAAVLLGKALGGDLRAVELILRRVWREDDELEGPEKIAADLEKWKRVYRAQIRSIRGYVERGELVPEHLIRDAFEPAPWAHEMEGMDRVERIRQTQMRAGLRGRPEDAWDYKQGDHEG